ncbi:MAG: hypothetical protein ABIG28_00185 [archaeon]
MKYPEYWNVFYSVVERGSLVVMTGYSVCSNECWSGKGIWVAKVAGGKVKEWRVYRDTEENRDLFCFD